MKLNFKEDTLPKFTFRDLEYGLKCLQQKRDIIKEKLYQYTKSKVYEQNRYNSTMYTAELKKKFFNEISILEEKMALVEDEMTNRMLTGNDDGMFESVVLGG